MRLHVIYLSCAITILLSIFHIPTSFSAQSCNTNNFASCCNANCSICKISSRDSFCGLDNFTCKPKQERQNCNASCNLPPVCRVSRSSGDSFAAHPISRSIFVPRSIGADTARELVGWQPYIHQFAPCINYLTTANSLGYSQSFRPERIARYLFGDNILNFAGSEVIDRTPCEIIADNFGLSSKFRGKLAVEPIIRNIFFDNQIFIGLNNVYPGFYLRIHAPIASTRWSLGMRQIHQEDDDKKQCCQFPACYMSNKPANSTCDIIKALSGNFTFGNMNKKWKFGKFCSKHLTKTGLADIDLIAGWDFWLDPNSHFGFYAQIVVPTGNKPKGKHIFEPILGNGKHWEFGGGISGHLALWDWCDEQSVSIWLEANVTHLFSNTQCRSFDFCKHGPLSRYLLLKEFEISDKKIIPTGNIINGINFTSRPARVSIGVKGDASVKLCYNSPCFSVDIGYNFYGNTSEKINIISRGTDSKKRYGIKGNQGVCALVFEKTDNIVQKVGKLVETIDLGSTESKSTIRHSSHIDNCQPISLFNPHDIALTALSKQSGFISENNFIIAKQSIPPILLSEKNLNKFSGAAGPTATHKVFGYVGFNLDSYRLYGGYIGLGGEFEVNGLACNEGTSLNQWSIFLKGGFAF